MKVILLERVEGTGVLGDVVTVKDGFARNFLLPRSKALRANSANLKTFELQRAEIEARNVKNRENAGKAGEGIDGKQYVLEYPIRGDVALIKAEQGDRWGNLTYRKAARNFGPVMAMASERTIATVHEIVELGEMDPESIVTPGIFVSNIVKIDRVATQAGGFKKAA